MGISAVATQKAATATDPIQKLFLDKIKEYNTKSKSSEGGLVDCTDASRKSLNDEMDKIANVYGAKAADFMKFPSFAFTDPVLEAVGVDGTAKEMADLVEEEEALQEEED